MPNKLITFETEWGWLGVAVSERGVAGVTFPQAHRQAALDDLLARWPDGLLASPDESPRVVEQLQRYFRGQPVHFDVPLDLSGHTPFLQTVWQATRAIPYGETRTYAELAAMAGRPRAYRAIGRAMAVNPIPIIIPCHRVIGSDGKLHGYGGGLSLKKRLLEMEQQHATPH